MQPLGESDSQALMTIDAPDLLNLACFVRDAAGLSNPLGYHVGVDYHWPYRENRFEERVPARTFLQASYQWPLWWAHLTTMRYETVHSGATEADTMDYQVVSASLDRFPELHQAVSAVWSSFWGWWLLSYAGGKMALETIDLPQDLYPKVQAIAPGRWHWDLVYRYDVREIRPDQSMGWAVINPHDICHNEWMTEDRMTKK